MKEFGDLACIFLKLWAYFSHCKSSFQIHSDVNSTLSYPDMDNFGAFST